MDTKIEDFVAFEEIDLNEHSGVYKRGHVYDHRQKVVVVGAYSKANRVSCLNITVIVQKCKVRWHYVVKVENELDTHRRLLCNDELHNFNTNDIEPGSRSCDNRDVYVIFLLYFYQSSPNKPN